MRQEIIFEVSVQTPYGIIDTVEVPFDSADLSSRHHSFDGRVGLVEEIATKARSRVAEQALATTKFPSRNHQAVGIIAFGKECGVLSIRQKPRNRPQRRFEVLLVSPTNERRTRTVHAFTETEAAFLGAWSIGREELGIDMSRPEHLESLVSYLKSVDIEQATEVHLTKDEVSAALLELYNAIKTGDGLEAALERSTIILQDLELIETATSAPSI